MPNKHTYLTGSYAKTLASTIVLDSRYPLDTRNSVKTFLSQYKNYEYIEMDLTEIPELGNATIQNGIGFFQLASSLGDRPIAGYTYFIGVGQQDASDPQTTLYPAFVAVQPAIDKVIIHEWGHGIGLGHEDNAYRWIKFKRMWRSEQSYFYGNISGGGFMAYGGKEFNPSDDFAIKKLLNPSFPAATVSGQIKIGTEFLKGANLIFIDLEKRFNSTPKPLPVRHSTIIDMLGSGDGSFKIHVPQGKYLVMLVPIGNYSRPTHGEWRLADSQIKDLTEPLFLTRNLKVFREEERKGIIELAAGDNLIINPQVRI